jgi:hypothetical protein
MISESLRDQLSKHFRDNDLYVPSKDPKQETADFMPRCMCGGGCAEGMCQGGVAGMKGYADGGIVTDQPDMSVPSFDVQNDTPDANQPGAVDYSDMINTDRDGLHAIGANPKNSPVSIPPSVPTLAEIEGPKPDENLTEGQQAQPAQEQIPPNPTKMAPDQWDALVRGLQPSLGQRLTNGAFQGLGALSDSIMQGVARAGPGQVQKNITEQQQQQKENLINALKSKYESQFKGKELGIAQQRANDENTRAANELTGQNTRAKLSRDLESKKLDQEIANENLQRQLGTAQLAREAASKSAELGQASRGWFSKAVGRDSPESIAAQKVLQSQSSGSGGPVRVTSRSQFQSLPKGTQFIDDSGQVKTKH